MHRFLQSRRIAAPRIAPAGVAIPCGFLSRAGFRVAMMPGTFPLGTGLAGEARIGTVAVSGLLLNTIKAVAFRISPLLSVECSRIGGAKGLCTIPGQYLGRWIVRHASIRVHALILEGFIALDVVCFW